MPGSIAAIPAKKPFVLLHDRAAACRITVMLQEYRTQKKPPPPPLIRPEEKKYVFFFFAFVHFQRISAARPFLREHGVFSGTFRPNEAPQLTFCQFFPKKAARVSTKAENPCAARQKKRFPCD